MSDPLSASLGTPDDLKRKAAEIEEALRELKPAKQEQKYQLLAMLLPTIIDLRNRKVTQKDILKLLESKGLKLHPQRFKELMAAEAEKLASMRAAHSEQFQ